MSEAEAERWGPAPPWLPGRGGRGGPTSEPFFTGGLLACSTPRLSDFPRKLGVLVFPWEPGPVPWEGILAWRLEGRLF